LFTLRKKITFPIPKSLIITLGSVTTIGSLIIFSSQYQSIRYLIPFIFMWELLLPLFIFTLIENGKYNKKALIVFIIILIVGSQMFLSMFDSVYFAL
jgi:hypothetical protein